MPDGERTGQMIRYASHEIVFKEVPDEVSLAFSITNCQGNCDGCHSPWLREDTGNDLEKDLPELLEKHKGKVTCICFLGEGNDYPALRRCLQKAKNAGYKTCIYSGKDSPPIFYMQNAHLVDYLKMGAYRKDLGPLTSPSTNQRMIRFVPGETTPYGQAFSAIDMTDWFWKNPFDEE